MIHELAIIGPDGTRQTRVVIRPHGLRALLTHDGQTRQHSLLIDEEGAVLDEAHETLQHEGPHRVGFEELLERTGSLTYEQAMLVLERIGPRATLWAEPSEPGQILTRTVAISGAGPEPAFVLDLESPDPRWLGDFASADWHRAIRPQQFVRAVVDDAGVVVVELTGGVRLYVMAQDDPRAYLHAFIIGPADEAEQAARAMRPGAEVETLS